MWFSLPCYIIKLRVSFGLCLPQYSGQNSPWRLCTCIFYGYLDQRMYTCNTLTKLSFAHTRQPHTLCELLYTSSSLNLKKNSSRIYKYYMTMRHIIYDKCVFCRDWRVYLSNIKDILDGYYIYLSIQHFSIS